MLRAPAAETTKTSCGQTRTRTFPALRRHPPKQRPKPRADAHPALTNAPRFTRRNATPTTENAPLSHTHKNGGHPPCRNGQRETRTPLPHTHKTAGVCPLFCCRRSRRDDAFVMLVPEVCPAVRHTLMQGHIPKPAMRLAAVTYAGTHPEASRPPHTYAGTHPKDSRPLRTWRGRSPCALGGWRRS